MTASSDIRFKIDRLVGSRNAGLRVLDLFAGCGGMSLGFQAAGFDIVGAVELDDWAARSHATNFAKFASLELAAQHARPRDIVKVDPEELVSDLGLGPAGTAIDVIVGGPPCQAYARVGRAKLREIAEHPQAFKVDPRANLYLRYLHYVRKLRPLALVMENVPDILNFGGHNVMQEIVDALDDMGYDAQYSLINSAHHGVPQMRDRVFMIAFHRTLGASIEFPTASNYCLLPQGYQGTRAVALKLIDMFSQTSYVPADTGNSSLPKAVTASEAIGDLPRITDHLEGTVKRGARRFLELAQYRSDVKPSSYALEMRNWRSFEGGRGVYDHVIRTLPRDTPIFAAMMQGDEYPAAQKVAIKLFETEARRRRLPRDSDAWLDLRSRMVPPYDPGKFPNRWWKLREDAPVRTLMAHLGKDTYSHIHYDSSQARVISVREAARLQSFPDGFAFAGTMNPAFRQIGNAVPPIMARAIARAMKRTLDVALLEHRQQLVAAQ